MVEQLTATSMHILLSLFSLFLKATIHDSMTWGVLGAERTVKAIGMNLHFCVVMVVAGLRKKHHKALLPSPMALPLSYYSYA